MDRKATQIMVHYKNVIEHRTFDEYDVLGFLIFIREYLCEKKYPFIKDFSHLVAHRGRDRGYIIDAIVAAISNCYKTKRKSNEVVGYYGMKYEKWQEEWKMFGQEYGILIDDRTIEELTVCVFSLSQFTSYVDRGGHGKGKIKLFVGKDKSLALVTAEGEPNSMYVCFSKFGRFELCRDIPGGYLKSVVEAVRIDGKLRLRDEKGYIF